MSVTTTADERLSSAQEHLRAAGTDLAAIVIDECWGYDDYTLDYKTAIRQALNNIIELKGKLQG
jgi:hypothetical protein